MGFHLVAHQRCIKTERRVQRPAWFTTNECMVPGLNIHFLGNQSAVQPGSHQTATEWINDQLNVPRMPVTDATVERNPKQFRMVIVPRG